ncbi:MAG TPA: hypothetical protein VGF21_18930 [Thermoleophilaceae bacterium]|jgi:hypothetical protein
MRYPLLVSGLALAVLFAAVSAAPAAKPHKNARYTGFEGSETDMNLAEPTARLRVSRSGRSFRRGSYVELSCRDDRVIRKVSLAGTRIRRSGKFSKSRRRGRIRYRLSGRFVLRDYARIRYTARRVGGCRSGRSKVALYEKGVPPFKSCRSQKAKNDVKNSDGRVFEQLNIGDSGEFFPFSYACLYSTGKRFELGRNWDDELVETPRLTAPYVAWASVGCGNVTCQSAVEVADLRVGKVVKNLPATTGGLPGNSNRVTDMVLKPNGSLAWIVDIGSSVGSDRQVVAVDSAGRRLLDSGGNIDPESLTLSGSTLSWTESGASRSASLN